MPEPFILPKADDADRYLDTALARAAKRVGSLRKSSDRVQYAKDVEFERLRTMRKSLTDALMGIHDAYPNLDRMSDFMRQLFELDMELGRVKQALGGVSHACKMIKALVGEHLEQVKGARKEDAVRKIGKAALGRIASVMRQVRKHLETLNQARNVFLQLPTIDDDLFTIAIAGFPNVGKSTLLARLTAAKPEIKPYAFTTKGLNVGYFEYRYNRLQCIDTPGTLNRENANAIERKADITLRYLAHVVVYVFDPTEGSYPLAQQMALYRNIEETGKPLLVYVSKTDLASKAAVDRITSHYPGAFTDPESLRKSIIREFKDWV